MNEFIRYRRKESIEFSTAEELSAILGLPIDRLRHDDELILEVSEDEHWWWVKGRTKDLVEGIKKWRGMFYTVVRVDSIHGHGLDTWNPEIIGERFSIRGDEIRSYSRDAAILLDGKEVKIIYGGD